MTDAIDRDVNTGATPQTKPLMYGDATFDIDRLDELDRIEMNFDSSYVEGYSEAKMENESRMANGLSPISMPKLLWIRVSTPDGLDTMADRGRWARYGYQFVVGDHKDQSCQCLLDLGWGGLKGVPAAAHVSRDGLIRREDLALCIVDSEIAERNRQRRETLLRKQNHGPRASGDISEVGRGLDNKVRRGSLKDAFANLPAK